MKPVFVIPPVTEFQVFKDNTDIGQWHKNRPINLNFCMSLSTREDYCSISEKYLPAIEFYGCECWKFKTIHERDEAYAKLLSRFGFTLDSEEPTHD
jgi:hypothetical protein